MLVAASLWYFFLIFLLKMLTESKHLYSERVSVMTLWQCHTKCALCILVLDFKWNLSKDSNENLHATSQGGSWKRWHFILQHHLLPEKAAGKHSQRGKARLVYSKSLGCVKLSMVCIKACLWLVLALLQGGLYQCSQVPSFLCLLTKPIVI